HDGAIDQARVTADLGVHDHKHAHSGRSRAGAPSDEQHAPQRVVDCDGAEATPVTEFLASLMASGASSGTARSYALALLRWLRFLTAVGVRWERASRVDVRDFVLWMRLPDKRGPRGRLARGTLRA